MPGARPVSAAPGSFGTVHGLTIATAILVKDRDAGTSARVALEAALR